MYARLTGCDHLALHQHNTDLMFSELLRFPCAPVLWFLHRMFLWWSYQVLVRIYSFIHMYSVFFVLLARSVLWYVSTG